MSPIQRNEVLGLGEYEQIRPHFRARVIEDKKPRLVELSPIMSVRFENRDSVLLQIQEILRVERISAEDGIQHEIDTYNEILPGPGQLSMTLFVQIADKDTREQTLVDLAGLEKAVLVEVNGVGFRAVGEDRSVEGIARTTAVHYLKVDLSEDAQRALRAATARAAIVIDHPRLELRVELAAPALRALASDFSGH